MTRLRRAYVRLLHWKNVNTLISLLVFTRVFEASLDQEWDVLLMGIVALLANFSYRSYRVKADRNYAELHALSQEALRTIAIMQNDARYKAFFN